MARKQSDPVSKIKKQAGRLDTPAPKIFRDKSKYNRKQKHRREFIKDEHFSGFFMSFQLFRRFRTI